MNLKSLYNYGLPQTWGNGVDKNALFIVYPPPPPIDPNINVSPSAVVQTVGDFKFCYILPVTQDLNGNSSVFYNNGDPIPILPGAAGNHWILLRQQLQDGRSVWAVLYNAVVNITYNGNTDPPTGSQFNDTLVLVNVIMSSPETVLFNSFKYTIKAGQPQLNNLTISAPASKEYDGATFDCLQFVTTESNAAITISYTGVSGTSYGPTSSPPKNAGNYSVSVSQPQTNYWSAASVSTTFSITKAKSISYFAFATTQSYYTGSARPLSCVTIPPSLAYTVLYNGSTTAPTNIGTYAVTAQIVDPNVDVNAKNTIIFGTYNIVKSNQITSTAANSTTLVRATYSSAINKFLVDFVGTYQ
jgi:hypothetical protein